MSKRDSKKGADRQPDDLGLMDEEPTPPAAQAADEAAPAPSEPAPVAGVGSALGVVQVPESPTEPHIMVRSVPGAFRAGGRAFSSNVVTTILLKDLTPEQLERIEHAEKHKMLKVKRST